MDVAETILRECEQTQNCKRRDRLDCRCSGMEHSVLTLNKPAAVWLAGENGKWRRKQPRLGFAGGTAKVLLNNKVITK